MGAESMCPSVFCVAWQEGQNEEIWSGSQQIATLKAFVSKLDKRHPHHWRHHNTTTIAIRLRSGMVLGPDSGGLNMLQGWVLGVEALFSPVR